MFDNLSNRLQNIFSTLRGKGKLSEADITAAMGAVRMALLEADVNFQVTKQFVDATSQRCLSAEVLDSLTPAQNVIKVVLEELTNLLGTSESKLVISQRIPNVIMLVGLQGSGKTTAAVKLAYRLKEEGHSPLLVACDVYRPAAADQLQTLGEEIGVKVYRGDGKHPVEIAKTSIKQAVDSLRDVVIIDTAGRTEVDEQMMNEAEAIRDAVNPDQVFMVLDAMTGQNVVNVAQAFAQRVDFDGVIMSKMDGDARGGGALSIRAMTGKPIKFISSGEKPDSLEQFYPDRMAKRILGMGDMVSLIEKASAVAQKEYDAEQEERMLKAEFTFDDFVTSLHQMKKMGGLAGVLSSLPGGDKALASGQVDERELDRYEAIVNSMTLEERHKPDLINGSRRQRIAEGCGVSIQQVNQFIARFSDARKMVKKMTARMGVAPQKAGRPHKGSKKGKKGKKGAQRQRDSFTAADLQSMNLPRGFTDMFKN